MQAWHLGVAPAVNCCSYESSSGELVAVTPDAAGSSPVDPANYPSASKGLPVHRGSLLANGAGMRGTRCLQATPSAVTRAHEQLRGNSFLGSRAIRRRHRRDQFLQIAWHSGSP